MTRMDGLYEAVSDSASRVYEKLGPGLSERAYHNAMETELSHRGIEFSSEGNFSIRYRGKPVAYRRPDLLVGDGSCVIVVELKAGSNSGESQLESYLELGKDDMNMDIDGGMLIQFNATSLNTLSQQLSSSDDYDFS